MPPSSAFDLLSWKGDRGRELDVQHAKLSAKRARPPPAPAGAQLRFADGSQPKPSTIHRTEWEIEAEGRETELRKQRVDAQTDERETRTR